jgi:hypothetical protein
MIRYFRSPQTTIALVGLALAAVLLLAPFLSLQHIPYVGDFSGSDLTELNLPLRAIAADQFRAGQIPLWTDLIGSGFPLVGEGQAGVFYPLNFLFVILPLPSATVFGLLIHFFLASLFTFFLVRRLGVRPLGSFLAALVFGYSGVFLFRIKHLNLINAATWLPLIMLWTEDFARHPRRLRAGVLLATTLAIQFFAGHPQVSWISVVAASGYYLFRFDWKTITKFSDAARAFGLWLAVALLTFGLSAIQFLPTAELTLESNRSSSSSYTFSTASTFNVHNLRGFIEPYPNGNPANNSYQAPNPLLDIFWEQTPFVGLLPLVLAVFACVVGWRRYSIVRAWSWMTLASLTLAFGAATPIFRTLWYVLPGLRLFRFPQRISFVTVLGIALLAGFGLDWLWSRLATRKKNSHASRLIVIGSCCLIGIVYLGYFGASRTFWGSVPADYLTTPPATAAFIPAGPGADRILSLGYRRSWWNQYEQSQGWMYSSDGLMNHREFLPPNLNALFHIPQVEDRPWSEGGQVAMWAAQLWTRSYESMTVGADGVAELDERTLKLWGMQNVGFFVSPAPMRAPGVRLAGQVGTDGSSFYVYKNPERLPRVSFPTQIRSVADSSEALAVLNDLTVDPVTTAAVIGTGETSFLPVASPVIEQWDNGHIRFSVDLPAAAFARISQTFYPGWRATIDGRPTQIFRTDLALQGLEIPAGRHQIELRFLPTSVIVGATVSVISWAVALGLFGLEIRRRRALVRTGNVIQ